MYMYIDVSYMYPDSGSNDKIVEVVKFLYLYMYVSLLLKESG